MSTDNQNESDTNQNYVNTLLWYVSHKVQVMKTDVMVPVCKLFFKSEDIEIAKNLLCEITKPKDRIKKRTGVKKDESNMYDIILMFQSAENLPQFSTVSCHFPPIDINHVDMASVAKELHDARNERGVFQKHKDAFGAIVGDLKNQVSILVTQMNTLQKNDSKKNQTDAQNQNEIMTPKKTAEAHTQCEIMVPKRTSDANTQCKIMKSKKTATTQTKSGENASTMKTAVSRTQSGASPMSRDADSKDHSASTQASTYSQALSATNTESSKANSIGTKRKDIPPPIRPVVRKIKKLKNLSNPETETQISGTSVTTQEKDSGKWQTVKHGRRRKPAPVGTMENSKLLAASHPIPIFVSRLDPSASEIAVKSFVQEQFPAETKVTCDVLKTRYDGYKSFKITFFQTNVKEATRKSKWPRGVLVKRFFTPKQTVHND